MDNKQFNEQRHNRKKQQYRFALGIQQLWNHPILNLIWLLFEIGVVFLVIAEKKYIANMNVYLMLETLFSVCITAVIIIFPIICAIGLIQLVGFCFAIKDEADLEIVFGDKRDVKNQPPMLIFKKKDRKSGVIKREFYTTIPMERWQEKKDAICDRLDVHLIGDITYNAVILPKFSNHSLRHTFTTRMCEAGVNIKAMQEILGHADAETTMDIYAEATKDLKKAELINFDEYFAKQKKTQSGN